MTHKKVDDPFRRKALRVFYAQKPWCSRNRLGRDLVHHALDSLEYRQIRLRFGDLCHLHAPFVAKSRSWASDSGNMSSTPSRYWQSRKNLVEPCSRRVLATLPRSFPTG